MCPGAKTGESGFHRYGSVQIDRALNNGSGVIQPCMGFDPGSVLFISLHDLVAPRKEDRGAEEGEVDEDLPFDMFNIFIRDVHERF